jgi:hypothetical protein
VTKPGGNVGLGSFRPTSKPTGRTELYGTHYRSLVRLAALLVRDIGTAE